MTSFLTVVNKRPYLLSFVICFAVSLIMTAPILFHLDHFFYQFNVKQVPGTDIFPTLWRIWWTNKAITQGLDPFYSGDVFHPIGLSFFFNQAVLWSDFIVFPLVKWIPLVAIHNLVFIGTVILAAWGMFSLAFHLSKNFWGSLLAGFIYSFNPFHFVHVDHLTTVNYQWIPLFCLFFIRMFQFPGLKDALLAAFFFAITCISDLNYGTFLVILGVVFAGYFLAMESSRLKEYAKKAALFSFFAIALAGPYAYLVTKTYLSHKETAGVSVTIDSTVSQSFDLLSLLTPSFMHPVFGEWVKPLYFRFATFNGVKISGFTELVGYLGLSVLFLGFFGFRSQLKDSKLWKGIAVSFFVLTLGPVLKCLGLVKIPAAFLQLDKIAAKIEPGLDPYALEMMKSSIGIPLPYLAIHFAPILKANEAPARFIVLGLLGLGILCAYGFQILWAKSKPRTQKWLFPVFAILICFEYYSVPSSIPMVQPPHFYKVISEQDPSDCAVVDIPLFGNSFQGDIRKHRIKSDPLYSMETSMAMYYQTFHHKKILVGAPDRRPTELLKFIQENEFLSALSNPHTLDNVKTKISISALEKNRIKYLVLHKDQLSYEEMVNIDTFLKTKITEQHFEAPYYEDSETRVYKVY